MTVEVDVSHKETDSVQVVEVQNVTARSVSALVNSGNVTFTYRDMYNGVWTTRPVLLPAAKAFVNTDTFAQGTAPAAGDGSSTLTKIAAVTEDVTGMTIAVTTGGDEDHRVIKSYDAAGSSVTTDVLTRDTTTATTYSIHGGMKAVKSNWQKLTSDGTTHLYLSSIDSVGSTALAGSYRHILSAAITDSSVEAFALRKGDWIKVGAGGAVCLLQLAADLVDGSTDLYTVKDSTTAPCLIGHGGGSLTAAQSYVYIMWKGLSALNAVDAAVAYDGGTKVATAYDSRAGQITIADAGKAGIIHKLLLPGTWIRLYRRAKPGALAPYCDFQLKQFQTTTGIAAKDQTTILYVNPVSATATTAGGSYLCQDFLFSATDPNEGTALTIDGRNLAAKWLGATSDVGVAYLATDVTLASQNANGAFPAKHTKSTAIASNNGVAVVTLEAALTASDIPSMNAGTLVYVMNDDDESTNHPFVCACTLTAAATVGATSFSCGTPPVIAGIAPTSCGTSTLNLASGARLRLFPGNSVIMSSSNAVSNPGMFQDLQPLDTVRLSNPLSWSSSNLASTQSASFQVSHMDPAATNAAAIYLMVGSKPNGGGMHPVLAVDSNGGALTSAGSVVVAAETDGKMLSSTFLVQPVSAAKAASTWTTTDPACLSAGLRVKQLFQELPDRIIDEVSVALTANTLGLYAFSVTFSGSRVPGNQLPITMNVDGCDIDGCQPRYTGLAIQSAAMAFDDVTTTAASLVSADKPNLSSANLVGPAGSTMLLYQSGPANADMLPNMKPTVTAIFTNGISTPSSARPTSLLVLKNEGSFSADDAEVIYFKAETAEVVRGTTEAAVCSNRGSCDSLTGICKCLHGYHGPACEAMLAMS